MNAELLHVTAVRFGGAGLLLGGPSGSGKSDLALRLIHAGGTLLGDDYVWIKAEDGGLYAMAPETTRGRIEVRGLGILTVPSCSVMEVNAVIDLCPYDDANRLPEDEEWTLAGISLPLFRLDPFHASAVAKVAVIAEVCQNSRRRLLR